MRALAWLPALAIAAAIWLLSSTPDLAVASGWLDTVTRKGAHIGVFGLLCAACIVALRAQRLRPASCVLGGTVIALVYAGIDEYHQSFVPTRNGTPLDVAIDAIGIGIAAMVLAMLYARREPA